MTFQKMCTCLLFMVYGKKVMTFKVPCKLFGCKQADISYKCTPILDLHLSEAVEPKAKNV